MEFGSLAFRPGSGRRLSRRPCVSSLWWVGRPELGPAWAGAATDQRRSPTGQSQSAEQIHGDAMDGIVQPPPEPRYLGWISAKVVAQQPAAVPPQASRPAAAQTRGGLPGGGDPYSGPGDFRWWWWGTRQGGTRCGEQAPQGRGPAGGRARAAEPGPFGLRQRGWKRVAERGRQPCLQH
jgi:hypothetical protein